MAIDITQILLALITLVTAVITTFLIPWLKSKTSSAQQDQLLAWVKLAVLAAEQLFVGGGKGVEKKEYVVQWLKDQNIHFDETTIGTAIEAAVYELKTK